jgi:hypothetical protein
MQFNRIFYKIDAESRPPEGNLAEQVKMKAE